MLKSLFFAVILLGHNTWALQSFKISPGRYISVESNILNPKEKVFVMLPGVFRAFDSRDSVIQLAKSRKMNFISINYSLQPEALRLIPSNERPYFETHHYSREDLADEIRAVLKKYRIEKPVIVGTSYSSSITTQLLKSQQFPLVVETAPMIQFDETDPQTVAILEFWKNWLKLNPFVGEEVSRQYLLNSFMTYWAPRVDELLKTYPQYRTHGLREKMILGYSNMSLLAEGFDFTKQDLTANRRFFIFGENEEDGRRQLQIETAKKYELLTGDNDSTVIVKKAGHVVPNDSPRLYLDILMGLD